MESEFLSNSGEPSMVVTVSSIRSTQDEDENGQAGQWVVEFYKNSLKSISEEDEGESYTEGNLRPVLFPQDKFRFAEKICLGGQYPVANVRPEIDGLGLLLDTKFIFSVDKFHDYPLPEKLLVSKRMRGIIAGPPPLARCLAGFATLRVAAISLRLGVTIVWPEELFATPTQPFSDALHDPVPPGQSSNIRKKQGRKGLKAGRKLKKRVNFSDYEEKEEAEEKAFLKRHSCGTFRPPMT
jgi:hypothetical protein